MLLGQRTFSRIAYGGMHCPRMLIENNPDGETMITLFLHTLQKVTFISCFLFPLTMYVSLSKVRQVAISVNHKLTEGICIFFQKGKITLPAWRSPKSIS